MLPNSSKQLLDSIVEVWLQKSVQQSTTDIDGYLFIRFGTCLHSEITLSVDSCEWRVEHNGLVLATRTLSSSRYQEESIAALYGLSVLAISITEPLWDMTIQLSGGHMLRLFSVEREYEHWQLKSNLGKFCAGPGTSHRFEVS